MGPDNGGGLGADIAKKPPTSITCGPGEEPRKLTDVANGKGKNAWVFNYALPADLDSNG